MYKEYRVFSHMVHTSSVIRGLRSCWVEVVDTGIDVWML